MQLPEDLKSYRAPSDDPFQLIEEGAAGWALLTFVIVLIILAPVIK